MTVVAVAPLVTCTKDFDALFAEDGGAHDSGSDTGVYDSGVRVQAVSCEAEDVQIAIDQAGDGDVVMVPSGACTWGSTVLIPDAKGITLRGAGTDGTVVTDALLDGPILEVNVSAPHFTRITGFTFDSNGAAKVGSGASVHIVGNGLDTFRVDHARFANIRIRGISINARADELSGLLDHNLFECPTSTSCQALQVIGAGPQISTHMARPYEPGSKKFIFAEDNTFNYTTRGGGGLAGYGGARYVFRLNTIHGATQGHSGAENMSRGTHSYEIYGNNFDLVGSLDTNEVPAHDIRSGTGFIFGNSYSSDYGAFSLDNYRSRDVTPTPIWGNCDGTQDVDGNQPGAIAGSGWPCLDQIGHVFNDKLDGSSELYPLYTWENRKAGSQYDPAPVGKSRVFDDIRDDRDFYVEKSSFDGMSGVGVGPIASRPSNCRPDVGYWAIDEGEWNATNGASPDGRFHRCSPSSSWTLEYTPYFYPHPLQSSPR